MTQRIVTINMYDKRSSIQWSMHVEELGPNHFRMLDNDLVNMDLTKGTEFETWINKDDLHQVMRITQRSSYTTRRFLANQQIVSAELFELFLDEIIKHGGYWQTDMGGIVTVNLPHDTSFDLDKVFKELGYRPTEIVDDTK